MTASPLRHRGALRRWELRFGPNMTPMVDVVMVILIFFMAATALLGPEWFLRSALPSPGAGAPPVPGDPFALPPARFDIRLFIDADGRTVADGLGARVSLDELEEQLAALGAEAEPGSITVLIQPTDGVPYRDVVRVHDACTRAAITQVGLLDGS